MKKALAILLVASPLFAVQDCTTLDVSAYNQEQINLVPSLAYEIGFAADNSVLPPSVSQSGKNVTVCFSDPNFSTASIITIASLVNQYNTDLAKRNAADAQVTAWQLELSTTTAALNTARQAGYANLTTNQKNAVVQGILQWHFLRCQLGIDVCQ